MDGITGKVIGFYDGNSGKSVPLPDNKNVVAPDKAKAEFLKQHPLRLAYVWPEYFEQKAPAPRLVYLPTFGLGWDYIDAYTGKTVAVQRD